jgi:hypothetical protein
MGLLLECNQTPSRAVGATPNRFAISTEALEALRARVRVAAPMVLDRTETRRDGAVRGIRGQRLESRTT